MQEKYMQLHLSGLLFCLDVKPGIFQKLSKCWFGGESLDWEFKLESVEVNESRKFIKVLERNMEKLIGLILQHKELVTNIIVGKVLGINERRTSIILWIWNGCDYNALYLEFDDDLICINNFN